LDHGRAIASSGQLDFDVIGRRLRSAHFANQEPAGGFRLGSAAVSHATLELINATFGERVGIKLLPHHGAQSSGIEFWHRQKI
jgi:hypothetical protein